MNFPSLAGLSLLPGLRKDGIAVSPRWTCEHAIIIECSLADLSCDDEDEDEDGSGEFEVVFEPDFSLDDEDGDGLVGLRDREEEDDDEEDDWPP